MNAQTTPNAGQLRGNATRCLYLLLVPVILQVVVGSGCNRSYYRRQADAEALTLIGEKANSPYWQLPDFSIDPQPESRMYQPFSIDQPPMPPDDPYSAEYMEVVDGKPGYPLWHANGDTCYTENPEWRQYLELNENGEVELNLTRAVELALIHSRDYQRQHEDLYLSALDVSLERFAFDTQFFAGYDTFFTADARDRTGTGASSTLDATTGARGLRLSKLGAAGSTLVVGFANTLLWEYSGTNTQSATTLIDFSLIQPLLRAAGRDRILEVLTDAERTLLANVRQLERFRRGFVLEITTGRSAGSGVSRGGNFLGGNPGGGVGGAGGMIGLLEDLQDIQIQESNVASLRAFLDQFREFNRVGRVDRLQVQQSESALYDAQNVLLFSRNAYQSNLDSFKILLGLPPDLPVVVDDPLLDAFKLIDPLTIRVQNDITVLQRDAGDAIISIEDRRTVFFDPADSATRVTESTDEGLYWSDRDRQDLERLKQDVQQVRQINRFVREEAMPTARQDVQRLRDSLPARVENLRRLRALVDERAQIGQTIVEPEILNPIGLEDQPAARDLDLDKLDVAFAQIDEQLNSIEASLDLFLEIGPQLPPIDLYRLLYSEVLKEIPKQLSELSGRFLELSLIQVRARTDTVTRTAVEISAEQAIVIARRHRRDWMNARADLVDAWRQIEFVADELESTFDLVFEGDISNVGNNPFDIRDSTGRLRAGFQFDAPITRLSERNDYREILIEYDRRRRQYYAYEDEVARSLREIIRSLEQNKVSFELSRRSILVAVEQVELARFNLIRPPEPGRDRQTLGATTARDLTSALEDLQRAQNAFLGIFVNYEVLRRTLDFELGTMLLNDQNLWIDPGPITPEVVAEYMQSGIEPFCESFSSADVPSIDRELLPEGERSPDSYQLDSPIPGDALPEDLNRLQPDEPYESIDPRFNRFQESGPVDDAPPSSVTTPEGLYEKPRFAPPGPPASDQTRSVDPTFLPTSADSLPVGQHSSVRPAVYLENLTPERPRSATSRPFRNPLRATRPAAPHNRLR